MSQPTHKLFEAYALLTIAAFALLVISCFRDQDRFVSCAGADSIPKHFLNSGKSADSTGYFSLSTHAPSFPMSGSVER